MSEAIADKETLAKAVQRGTGTLSVLRKDGLAWQGKHDELQDKMKNKNEALTFLERRVVGKSRQFASLDEK